MPGYPEQVRVMTGMVGRSDGSHPQDAEGCSLLPLSANHFLSLRLGRELRSLAFALTRAARSRRPGRFAARFPSVANASSGAARGVCYQGVRAAGPERATARRAEWRVRQASGARARR